MGRTPRQLPLLVIGLVAIAGAASAANAADAADSEKPRTGRLEIRIADRSPASNMETLIERMGWGSMEDMRTAGAETTYAIENERFQAYVPDDYDGSQPYGLLVWISAGPTGGPPDEWLDVLRKRKLIWIGPDKAGNDRSSTVRLALAIDAAVDMQQAYKIDKDRVYVSGLSGGGRCASHLGIAYPDVFTGGGLYIIGCNFYRPVEHAPGKYYRRKFARPKPQLMKLAQTARRHVFLTGNADANREQTRANYLAAKQDGFKQIAYIEVPQMGHQPPDAEWFDKAVAALDDEAAREAWAAKGNPKSKPKLKPAAAATAAATKPAAPSPAAKELKMARMYAENRLYAKARAKLKALIEQYPKSTEAAEGRKLLEEIGEGLADEQQ